MADNVSEFIFNRIIEQVGVSPIAGDFSWVFFLVAVLLSPFLGYLVGYSLATLLEKVLKTKKIEVTLVKYGAVTSELWENMITFLGEYIKWLMVVLAVDLVLLTHNIDVISQFSSFLIRLLALIVSTILGILLGGVVYKITKDFLVSVGLERELGKHQLSDNMAGFSVSTIVAFVVKWYIVLLFLTTGLQIFKPVILLDSATKIVLLSGLEELTAYVPQAILGFIIVLAAVIISDFAAESIRARQLKLSETYSFFAEVVIISIGALLALPHFGVQNTYFLEYSFVVLMAGIALGVAVASGLTFRQKLKDME